MAQPVKFYYDLMSQPCRALYIFMKMTNIPFEDFPIALRKGVHLTDEYKNTINRFKKVPAIIDEDYKLSESVAIIRYLSAKHKQLTDPLYPDDLQARGRIDEYLEWQHTNTRSACMHYFILKYLKPRVAGKAPGDDQIIASAQKQMEDTLNTIENLWLEPEQFLAGENISVADILAAAEIEQPRIAGFEPAAGRPKMHAWLQAVKEASNPHYDEAHRFAYKLGSDSKASDQIL